LGTNKKLLSWVSQKKLILNRFFYQKLKIYLFEKFIKKTASKIFTLSLKRKFKIMKRKIKNKDKKKTDHF